MSTDIIEVHRTETFLGEESPLNTLKGALDWYDDRVEEAKGKPPGTISIPVMLTPHLAQVCLDHNVSNRKTKKPTLQKYINDIESGAWQPNGQPIVIAENGDLNDGQHRCKAVLRTGTAVYVLMTFGWPRASRLTLDIGTKRSTADALAISGHSYAAELAAVTKKLWWLQKHGHIPEGSVTGRNEYQVSNATLQIYADQVGHEVYDAIACVPQSHKIREIMNRSDFYLMAVLLRRSDPARTPDFLNAIVYGLNLSNDDPAYHLRERLFKDRKRLSSETTRKLVMKYWNRWLKHHPS